MKLITGVAVLILGLGMITCANRTKNVANTTTTQNDEQGGIKFRDISLEEAKKAAKKEKKLIFIDVYASWCGPCKMLDKNTFSDKSVGTYFNDKFICLKIDGDRNQQDGSWKHPDGKEVMETYGVTAFPTLLWIDAEGILVKKELCYKSPEQLLRVVQDIK